jgi:nitrite reductase (NADH) small subunit/3-phenylpropionate/trans-cinnamate dioxygenase ferredoxin subunit
MSEFKSVAKVGAVPEGQGRCFTVDGRMVGVFLLDGQYYAINDLCPHMGASLASGWLDRETASVSCPWHAWRFSVKDGTWLDNPKIRTECYDVRVEGDSIQVRFPDRQAGPGCAGNCTA